MRLLPTVLAVGLIAVGGMLAFAQTAGQQGAPTGARGRGAGTYIVQQAPTDKAADFPLEWLQNEYKSMDAAKRQTTRMIEGGKYNVNIRRITAAETALVHPITADVWVVTEGEATLTTGGELKEGKIIGGVSRRIKTGDVIFIPAGVPHGVSGVPKNITWLNIRFDTKEAPQAAQPAGR